MYKIYGKNVCVYCTRAKKLLNDKNLEYEYFDIEQNSEAYIYARENSNGQETMPIIFKDNKLIGGFDQLRSILK